ncbi:MAG: hypothetical protein LBV20_02495 [Treponema sp.]|jgi:hypothetical protein|nr:hypothetical protein [Treponema sp.]
MDFSLVQHPDDYTSPMLGLDVFEEEVAQKALLYIKEQFPSELQKAEERFSALKTLGNAISLFPSVRETQRLRGDIRDEESLIASMIEFSPSSRFLHTPTRIVSSRGFLVAKSHAFSMLSFLTAESIELLLSIRKIIFSIICTLMAEDVYIACINDPSFPKEKKRHLAEDLIFLWDCGADPRSTHNLPALQSLWSARDAAPPCFGTMEGSSELIRLSIDLDMDWQNFITSQISHDETRWALEEFLFGISFEEIIEVRSRLKRFGISAVDHNEIRSYLGSRPSFTMVDNNDPRGIYDFYVERRDTAFFRERGSSLGPKKTLEELYLRHRMAME